MKRVAVILYGAPGSGKGTQAYLLNHAMDLMHVDTGQILEAIVHDPKRQHEKAIQRERKLWDSGKLNSHAFAHRAISKYVQKIAKAGFGVIFSGSPRRLEEAQKSLPLLEKLYGKKNIYFFILKVPEKISLERNSHRLLCTTCGLPFLSAYATSAKNRSCRVCGGTLRKRVVDNPEIIKVRLQEYQKRTTPIFKFARSRGYRMHEVDGTPAPAKVFEHIMKVLNHPLPR